MHKRNQQFSIVVIITLTLILLYLIDSPDRQKLVDVQTGKSTLFCHLKTGYTNIDKERVINYLPNGQWIFDNGSATQCEITYKDKDNENLKHTN